MITSISSNSNTTAPLAAYAPTANKNTGQQAATTVAPAPQAAETSAAPAQSTESAAAARLGNQLDAQADATRVQRAVDEAMPAAEAMAPAEAGETGADDASATEATAAQAPAGRAAPTGGASAPAASATTDTVYLAEADTNSDKTVSDEERAVYEARQRQQADEASASKQAEVQAAYGQDETAAPVPDITASSADPTPHQGSRPGSLIAEYAALHPKL